MSVLLLERLLAWDVTCNHVNSSVTCWNYESVLWLVYAAWAKPLSTPKRWLRPHTSIATYHHVITQSGNSWLGPEPTHDVDNHAQDMYDVDDVCPEYQLNLSHPNLQVIDIRAIYQIYKLSSHKGYDNMLYIMRVAKHTKISIRYLVCSSATTSFMHHKMSMVDRMLCTNAAIRVHIKHHVMQLVRKNKMTFFVPS